ncbi:MAG: HEAT repeat domain-containing protein [Chlamydiales bacterium]|nr:HEAT repeat domain-containing protein [Chlamydiales bacterium]
MYKYLVLIIYLLSFSSLEAQKCYNLKSLKAEILYKTRAGNLKGAIDVYKTYRSQIDGDDFELLQQIAFTTLEQGYRSKDPQEQFLAIYGAGMARSSRMLYIFERGLSNEDPKIQLASLYFLNDLHDDRADELVKKAMSSNYVVIRLEAAKMLAAKKDLNAALQIEGLMCKLDPVLLPLFPPLFALAGDTYSTIMLKKFLSDPNPELRLATILSIIDYKRDDLLPRLRTLAIHGNHEEQEAASFALGELKDRGSLKILETQSKCNKESVRLAALLSLYKLGDIKVIDCIAKLALQGNIFAISALGNLPETEELLFLLSKNANITVRFNAALALLQKRDARCTQVLLEILLKDSKDLAVIEYPSPGFVMSAWRVVHSASARVDPTSQEAEILTTTKDKILSATIDLPTEDFFKLAAILLDTNDPELVPTLISLIESLKSTQATEFLVKELQRAGAPLLRSYCNLALFRLREPGPYAEYVRAWVKELRNIDLITFRPFMPRTRGESSYALTPGETSRLFVEALTALSNQKDPEAIDALLTAISGGYPSNRYALAGLLIRATE